MGDHGEWLQEAIDEFVQHLGATSVVRAQLRYYYLFLMNENQVGAEEGSDSRDGREQGSQMMGIS